MLNDHRDRVPDFTEMTLAELVIANSDAAPVLRRFRLDYCCSGPTLFTDACALQNIQTEQVLEELYGVYAAKAYPDPHANDSTTGLLRCASAFGPKNIRPLLQTANRLLYTPYPNGRNKYKMRLAESVFHQLEIELYGHFGQEQKELLPRVNLLLLNATENSFAPCLVKLLPRLRSNHRRLVSISAELEQAANELLTHSFRQPRLQTLLSTLRHLLEQVFAFSHLENNLLYPRLEQQFLQAVSRQVRA